MLKKQAVISLNGQLQGKKEDYLSFLNSSDYFFIAADGGVKLLEEIDIIPDLLLGDFDSVAVDKLEYYKKENVEMIKFPVEKDETDGELAINYCLENDFNDVIIIGAKGGRTDQELANIFLLEYAYHKGLRAIIKEPGLEMGIIDNYKEFNNYLEHCLSLIPLNKKVAGISINGCKYRLDNDKLYRYKTRGISNKIIKNKADVSVKNGIILYLLLDNC